ncbi:hypothetical protein SAY87_025039 [Trapa incisa]|uniref:F-box associated beta-propeller type 3 domain-containing protein n=1 Tax=Trapa incisa TaxID=236973 RepID=A0AAN7GDW0_9MYRT|nr:hypothetical protein SAY87_025039 [Trapa incisa]
MDQWRSINTHVPTSALFLTGYPIFLRGSIHWLGYRSDITVVILAFNVHGEVFFEIEVPSAIVQPSDYSLHAHGESLCILDNRCSRDSGAVPFWVMEQYGEKQSWCNQFIIEIHNYNFRVLGFWKEDKFLIENSDGEIVSYDGKVGSTKVVLASEEGTKVVLAIPYMECLVLLKGSDGPESRVDGSSSASSSNI